MWPGRPAARSQDVLGGAEHAMTRPEQERRVEVALDGVVRAELLPGHVERQAPVDADDVAAGGGEVGQDRRRPGAEMNRRDVGRLRGRRRPSRCAGWRTRGSRAADSAPTHESKIWMACAPASTCATTKPLTTWASRSHSRCHASGWPYISALVRAKSRDGPPSMAYDARVNGAPAKPMSGTRPSSSRRVMRDRLQHVAEAFTRVEQPEPFDVGFGAERLLDARAFALDEVEGQAHRLEGQQQVREDDGGVDVDGVDRLQRDAGGQLGRPAELEEGVSFA